MAKSLLTTGKRKDSVPIAQRAAEKRRKPYKLTQAQTLLGIHLGELGLNVIYEHAFAEGRSWRLDLFLPEARIGIECNGGKWASANHSGGHRRMAAIDDENLKVNTAQMMGIRVLQFANDFVLTGQAKEFLKTWL